MNNISGAKSVLQGYTDAIPMNSKFDFEKDLGTDNEIKGIFNKAKGPNSKKKYGKPKVTQADINNIKDFNTKKHIQKHYSKWVHDGKPALELTSNNPFIDILRNHALAVDRSTKYCKQFNLDCDKIDLQGAASALMIDGNANASKVNKNDKVPKDKLSCPERRGAELKFIFDDNIKRDDPSFSGDVSPEFKITTKKLQNNLHLAGALDMFKRMNSNDFKHPSGNPKSDPMFMNIKEDRKRFKEVMKDNPGCANDDYSIDAARRMYWAVMNEKNLANEQAKKASPSYQDLNSKLQNFINKADYSNLNKNKEVQEIFTEANDAEEFGVKVGNSKGASNTSGHVTDMYNGIINNNPDETKKFKKTHPEIKSLSDMKLYAQLVLTARTITTGRPVFSQYTSGSNYTKLHNYEKGLVYGKNQLLD